MNKNILITIMLFLLIYTISIYPVYSQNQVVEVTIRSDGVVSVEMNVTVSVGINHIKLPIEPIPESINVVEDGKNIPPIYYNKTIVIPIEKSGTAIITYIANVTIKGGKATIEIGSAEVVLKVMKGIVLLSIPKNVNEFKTIDNTIVINFLGPAELSYTIAKSKPAPSAPATARYFPMFPWWIPVISIAAIVIIISIYVSTRRRHSRLDHLDRDILDVLRKKGGKALQSELMNELDIPKTTLWRHVKRLEALGYVKIEKVGRVNVVELIK